MAFNICLAASFYDVILNWHIKSPNAFLRIPTKIYLFYLKLDTIHYWKLNITTSKVMNGILARIIVNIKWVFFSEDNQLFANISLLNIFARKKKSQTSRQGNVCKNWESDDNMWKKKAIFSKISRYLHKILEPHGMKLHKFEF